MSGFLRSFHAEGFEMQPPFDVAVVIPSILRPTLGAALRSIFGQAVQGRIHVLIGIDGPGGRAEPDLAVVEAACREIPPHILVQVLWPGFSTSVRHGGLWAPRDGGALRALLTLLANADHVAYLDDDNILLPDHLRTLRATLAGHDYAFSLRWFAHHETMRPIAVDVWESVGPGEGVFKDRFGGFVDPNTLMIDRQRCREVIMAWTTPLPGDVKAMSADRMVFDRLRRMQGACTRDVTVLYKVDPTDEIHPLRLRLMNGAYEAETRNTATGP